MLDRDKIMQYDFMKDKLIEGNKLIYVTLGGSYAYGLNVESSDIDLRGVALEGDKVQYGLLNFEQWEDKVNDINIYSFKKIIRLLIKATPNILEMFATEESDVIYSTESAKLLRANIGLFLTSKVKETFGGYARAQFAHLQKVLVRENLQEESNELSSENIKEILKYRVERIKEHFDINDNISLDVDKNNKLVINLDIQDYSIDKFIELQKTLIQLSKNFNKLNSRNQKSEIKLQKHVMHLIRLVMVGTKILDGKGIKTKMEGTDRELLMDIRLGKFNNQELYTLSEDFLQRFDRIAKNNILDSEVNMKTVEDLMYTIYKLES